MRFFQIFHLIVFVIIFSACSSILSQFGGISSDIPKVKNIKTIVGVSSVAFEWDIVADSNGYVLYRDGGKGYEEVAYIKNPLTSHYVDTRLVPEREYSYYFHTLGKNSYSDRSDIIKVKTSYINPVTNLYASNDYPRKVKLLWNPHQNPSISHYLIQRGDSNDNFKTIATIDNRLSVEYFDENLNDASIYKYRIIAVDFLGTPSRPSKIVVAKTKDRPSINVNLRASNDYLDKIELTWNPQKDIAKYKIYRSKTSNGKYNHLATTSDTKFIDGAKIDSEYFYKIIGVDSANIESLPSNEVRGSTKALIAAPKIMRGYIDNNKARIEWSGSPEAKHYIVYRSSGFFGSSMKFRVDENYFVDNDMANNEEYTYYVVAVDEFGVESKKSQEVTLQIR